MATAFHRDEQTTNSRDVAVLAHYLGYPLVRVEISADHTTETFTVLCPLFDFEQVVSEAVSDSTTAVIGGIGPGSRRYRAVSGEGI